MKNFIVYLFILIFSTFANHAIAQEKKSQILFTNVQIIDGVSEKRIENANVLVEGNLIKQVTTKTISANGVTIINGVGRTLMPGLIDVHYHKSLLKELLINRINQCENSFLTVVV